MKAPIFVILLSFTLLTQINSQCSPGSHIEIFIEGNFAYKRCIVDGTQVTNCLGYDYKDFVVPYTCIFCQEKYSLIKFENNGLPPACIKTCDNPVPGCQMYTADYPTNEICLDCILGLTELPVYTLSGKKEVICTDKPLIIGDGIQFSTCLKYKKAFYKHRALVLCAECASIGTITPNSADCSITCSTNDESSCSKSLVYYLDDGEVKSKCIKDEKQQCKLFQNCKLKSCVQCYQPYFLVTAARKTSCGCIVKKHGICIPPQDVIPGCAYYCDWDPSYCLQCDILNTTNSQSVLSEDDITYLNYYQKYQICAPNPGYIIGNCTRFKENGLGCAQCEFGHILITKYHIHNIPIGNSSINKCPRQVIYCQLYDFDYGICVLCIPRYYLLNQVCYPVARECLTYVRETGMCTKCINQFIPSKTPGKCDVDSTCPKGKYFDSKLLQCYSGTISNCWVYEIDGAKCVLCADDYILNRLGLCKYSPKVVCNQTAELRYEIVQSTCRYFQKVCTDWRIDEEDKTRMYCFDCVKGYIADQGICKRYSFDV